MPVQDSSEYLARLIEKPADEVIPLLVHDVKGEVAVILLTAQMIAKAMRAPTQTNISREKLTELAVDMQEQLRAIRTMLDAALDYNDMVHGKNSAMPKPQTAGDTAATAR